MFIYVLSEGSTRHTWVALGSGGGIRPLVRAISNLDKFDETWYETCFDRWDLKREVQCDKQHENEMRDGRTHDLSYPKYC